VATGRIILCVSNDLKVDQRIQRICGTLSRAGYLVRLIGFGPESSRFQLSGASALVQKTLFRKGKAFYLEIQIRLLLFLFLRKADLICACDADTLVPAFWASRLRRRKLVFDAHEFFSETSGVEGRSGVKKFWRRIEDYYIPKVDMAYTVSQGLVEIMEKEFGVPFNLIRNLPEATIDVEVSREFEKGTFWIYQGAMNKGRGLEKLLEAMKESKKDLVLAGDGPLKKDLERKKSELDLGSKVKFLGRVDPVKLKGITMQAYAGINLVDGSGLSYRHSLANKFFDYMAAGIPQINSDLPEYRNICQEYPCSQFVEDNSVNAITRALQVLENNEDAYERMKEEAKKASGEFIWENEEKKLLAIYANIYASP
jgi:glycosyltransferase involved in cell wall biosynthesis